MDEAAGSVKQFKASPNQYITFGVGLRRSLSGNMH